MVSKEQLLSHQTGTAAGLHLTGGGTGAGTKAETKSIIVIIYSSTVYIIYIILLQTNSPALNATERDFYPL